MKNSKVINNNNPRYNVDKLCVSRKEGGRRLASIEVSVDASIQPLKDYIKKAPRKTDNCDQKQYRQHKHQQNKNNQKTIMGRKTTIETIQATDKRNLTRENMDMAKKEKP